MPTSQTLQHLYSFNTFSPEFSRCLDRLIRSDEEDRYLFGLQGLELTRLVDFLDRVRVLPLASNLINTSHRPLGSSLSLTTFPDDVYTSYKPSAATPGSYRLPTLFLAVLSQLAITQLPPRIFPMYGKANMAVPKCVSKTRKSH